MGSRSVVSYLASSCPPTEPACIEVFCGWPLSGQYGFGQRVLYYILLATCVLARRKEWIRAVCIAAALLVPAVAAIHGIVLAALHVDGAIDVDVYGALQFCTIGILAVPITVKVSDTYFHERGRNTVFVWTGLLLAGLLSLAVEFYRSNAIPCFHDNDNNPISSNPKKFPYGGGAMCGLTCSQQDGPFSLLRSKAASEIFVVPQPDELQFGYAMFLAAACCVPAIISLISMRNKIVITDWIKRQGAGPPRHEKPTGALETESDKPSDLYKTFRGFLNTVEILVFGGVVLAILIIGEVNFWSPQMDYHTEPMGSIGQWGTIVATGLAAIGSFLLKLLDDIKEPPQNPMAVCGCTHCQWVTEAPQDSDVELQRTSTEIRTEHFENGLGRLSGASTLGSIGDPGYRRRISRGLVTVGTWFGTATEDPFGAPDVRGTAWPHIPGESIRNSRLALTSDQFSTYREIEPAHTEAPPEPTPGGEDGSTTPKAASSSQRDRSISPKSLVQRAAAPKRHSEPSTNAFARDQAQPERRSTLDVPKPPNTHHRLPRL
ncbi:hypothetical protein CCHL11_00184 [Colletotrichum chlorophyti]|uniref:Uncharacterized protein n=1 Tax=Colletotrichum chlorophyti TaxID=708187 RepID=A0A1Q8RUW7_9PEZI|nr:hypothetical protein CCHL11_00184 [Colletotrichum chlorophyti]